LTFILFYIDNDATGMLESLRYNKIPSSSLLTLPVKAIQKPEMDKSLNVAKPNTSGNK